MRTNLIQESPILFAIVLSILLLGIIYKKSAIIVTTLLLLVLLLWFYRLPTGVRSVLTNFGKIYSACYGTIKQINIDPQTGDIHIITFLSFLDIHQQYYPISGTIVKQIYDHSAKFHLAFDIGKSHQNEKILTIIKPDDPLIPGEVCIQRIAGFFVRRITTVNEENDHVNSGERMGMIKFGSRVDLILPAGAKLHVSVGDKITKDTLVASY